MHFRTIFLLLVTFSSLSVDAQVVRDGTIGPDRTVQPDLIDGRFDITEDMGERSGNNLFHSFEQFNIGEGEQAFFSGSTTIENVISRVTGGGVSQIDGVIGSTIDGANLFLINPSGVVLGPNAQIQVGGSINLSTGTLVFSDGQVFAVSSGQVSPILSSASPSSFGFLSENVDSSIDIRGAGFWLENDFNLSSQNINILDGAAILSGLGYDITMEAENDITFSGYLSRAEILQIDDISAGSMEVSARNIFYEDGGSTSALSFGTGAPGEINISASELIQVSSEGSINLFNYSPSEGTNLTLTANVIEVGVGGEQGSIETQSFGGGGGNISLIAEDRIIGFGTGDTEDLSYIASFSEGWMPGGEILIDAPIIEMDNGFQVMTHAIFGPGGNISLTADDVTLNSSSGIRTMSGDVAWGAAGNITLNINDSFTMSGLDTFLSTLSLNVGAGGDIAVNAGSIEIVNSAELFSFSSGSGAGGSIYLNAQEDISFDMQPSANEIDALNPRIMSFADGVGNGGDITLTAANVSILEGSAIKSAARNEGSGGDIRIQAEETITVQGLTLSQHGIDLDNLAQVGLGSDAGKIRYSAPAIGFDGGAYQRSNEYDPSDHVTINQDAAGEGGDIYLQAENIAFIDGAYVETNTDTNGAGGSITLDAEQSVDFTGVNFLGASSLLRSSTDHVSDAGDISVNAENINLTDGAILFSENLPSADGATGNITLVASNQITISGGNPNNVAAPPSLQTVSRNDGDSGFIDISTSALEMQDARLNTETQSGTGGNISLDSDHIYLSNSTVTTSVTGDGDGGDIDVSSESLVLDDSSAIIAQANTGNGGTINLNVEAFAKSADSVVDASSREGIDGVVSVKPGAEEHQAETPVEAKYIDASSLIRTSCASYSQENSLTLFQTSGALISPEGPLPLGNTIHALSEIPEFSPLASGGGDAYKLADSNVDATENSNNENVVGLLNNLGNSAYRQGAYRSAVDHLTRSAKLAEENGDESKTARIIADLGNTLVAVGKENSAEKILVSALTRAKRIGDADLTARVLNNLGNYYVVRGDERKGLQSYKQSMEVAQLPDQNDLLATVQANTARASLSVLSEADTLRWLASSENLLETVNNGEEKAEILINLSKTYELLARKDKNNAGKYNLTAYSHLRNAERIAKEINNPRILSYAIGSLGGLYQQQNRPEEALVLTRGAIVAAEKSGAAESLYRWYWQEAKLLWLLGDGHNAIRSYRRALAIVESSRQASIARYESSSSFFKRLVEPVYLDMVDALILTADKVSDAAESQMFLQEARQVVENLKTAEMENYFQDECLVRFNEKRKSLDEISSSAAIVYPIIMQERLELLVSLPQSNDSDTRHLKRYQVDISAETLNQFLSRFREHLERYSGGEVVTRQAQQLYQYLVKPYRKAIENAGIDTIVFVPDGALRSIPLSALHDGEAFLLRNYAVAVTSSLVLSDSQALADRDHTVLLAGVSEAVNGLPALDAVPQELNKIHELFEGELLLNEDFTARSFEDSIQKSDISIVHIASHAKFTGDYQNSFLQTFDKPLYSEALNQVLSTTKYRERGLELLVLSACQTAAGNDQSALGLAGIGIKAGAQSAMGSLWNISDEATSILIREFYTQIKGGEVSKAQALRHAQLKLLENREYEHPFFWSPFLLIDNWL